MTRGTAKVKDTEAAEPAQKQIALSLYPTSNEEAAQPPPAYDPRFVKLVRDAGERGATFSELLLLLDISSSVMLLWRMCYPEFEMAVKEALRVSDTVRTERVEEALYRRALGYEFKSEKIVTLDGRIKRVETMEHVPPDVGAANRWLETRDPERWKPAKRLLDAHLTVGRIDEDMPPEEAAALFRATIDGAVIEGEFTEDDKP